MPKTLPLPTLLDILASPLALASFSERALAEGREAVERERVARPRLSAGRATAVVVGTDRRSFRAMLTASGGDIVTSCTCTATWCGHAAALALLLTGEAHQATEDVGEGIPAREAERLRRESRGTSELFEIRRRPGGRQGLLGEYEVASPSSRAYVVTLRALDAAHNGCTCPDFATNLLGTCKHVEAVLHRLRTDAPRRWQGALVVGPAASYLHLAFDPQSSDVSIGIRLAAGALPPARRVAARFFGPRGRLQCSLTEVWPELARSAVEAGVEVPAEVARLGERHVEAARAEKRRTALETEVRAAGTEQPGLRRKLYPYQVAGVAFLASRGRALLADEMGLGKTAQAIAAMAQLVRRGEVRRALIVCPASLKHQWLRELRDFTDLGEEDVAVVGGPREARRAAYAEAPPVLVTSYELARADEPELLDLAPDLLVLDEAQRVKNWRTRTAAVVKGLRSRFAFVLTGTPLENRLDDLYSLMQVVDPHRFGPLWRFNEEFTTLDASGRPVGYRNLDLLRERIAPVMLRRRKEQVLADLPERIVSRLTVPMTAKQQAIHEDAEGKVSRLLAILKERPLSPVEEQRLMRAFQRMRMACDAAGLVDEESKGAPKLDELERLLEEICLGDGRKVVIFSEWERMQAMAAEVCEKLGVGYVRLHGGVPSGSRGKLIDRFREDPECRAFLSTDAGGVGLNLQAASHVVNLDLPWNPAVLAQRIARVHRIGQREAVNVVLLVSEGSFEERMEGTLDSKRALFAAAVGDDRGTTELERSSMARRIATLLSGEFAASTGKHPPATKADPVATLRERVGPAPEQVVRARRGLAALASRKQAAASALVAAQQPGEALPLYREAMSLSCRSLDPQGDPGDDPAALLAAIHARLLPEKLLTEDDAAALARAGEAARAFGASPVSPPESLVARVAAEAAALVGRATAGCGG